MAVAEIAAEDHVGGIAGNGSALQFEGGEEVNFPGGKWLTLGVGGIHWPYTGVWAQGMKEAVRAGDLIAGGDAGERAAVACANLFEVEPHDELLGGATEKDFGAFQDATAGNR